MSGRRMDLRAIAQAGERRAKALDAADAALERIIDEVEQAGELRNVDLAARLSGITRRTIYTRLAARRQETAAK